MLQCDRLFMLFHQAKTEFKKKKTTKYLKSTNDEAACNIWQRDFQKCGVISD